MSDSVLITEAVHAGLGPLGRRLRVDLRPDLWSDRSALLAAARDCDALVVRNQTHVDSELLSVAARLRVVARLGAGLENVDLEECARRGVVVLHGGGLNARAVAEYVIGAILVLARGLLVADRSVREGRWERRAGVDVRGRTIGVVGLGRTGAATARLARALGMKALGYDPFLPAAPGGVRGVDLPDLLAASWAVSVHVPLSDATQQLIGEAQIARLPRNALIVNAARGGVVDEDALYDALVAGRLGGAALDVRRREPPAPPDRFASLDNVLLTPHIAGLTQESQRAIAASVLSDVRRVLGGHPPRGPAIVPALTS